MDKTKPIDVLNIDGRLEQKYDEPYGFTKCQHCIASHSLWRCKWGREHTEAGWCCTFEDEMKCPLVKKWKAGDIGA